MIRPLFLTFLLLLFTTNPALGDESPFGSFLDLSTIGADAFRKALPDRDGRGVVIAVLDTGIDMSVPGVDRDPSGEVKVLEARDFTGEGWVDCDPAAAETGADGKTVWRTKTDWVRGVETHVAGGGSAWVGFLDETRYRNASVQDLNGNGRKDDRFAVLLFRDKDGRFRAVVDRAGDRNLADDPVVEPYARSRQFVRLAGFDPSRGIAPVAMALHLEASEDGPKRVQFHVPAGSHGTHVAGIAAGFRIDGRDGFDGVAPGAKLLSLKIGDNTLAGGSTVTESLKKALEFAARWGREHDVPVVVNLSYGVGSETEGLSDIDRFVDRFAEENPHVFVATSAGNGGPGLSTIGSPAAALHATASAAVFSPASGRDLMGASPGGTRVFSFSSRGAELAKPDVAAPGIATSTVPYWERRDTMRGTSMASPQVAGAAALVLSAALARDPKLAWNSGMLRRALRDSARPLAGYGPLDVGAGIVQVRPALDRFLEIAADTDASGFMDVEVSAPVPTLPDRKGRALWWRTGGWAPDGTAPVTVTLKARFAAGTAGRDDFFRTFSLTTDASWVRLSKGSVALKSDQEAQVDVWVEPAAIERPGIHTALVTGKGGTSRFSFPVTVVRPYVPRPIQGVRTVEVRGLTLSPGDVARIPVTVPPGATALSATASAVRDRKASAYLYLYDLQGRRVPLDTSQVSSEKQAPASVLISSDDLLASGTYEFVLFAVPTARFDSTVDLAIRFFDLDAAPVKGLITEPGSPPKARVTVTNGGAEPFTGTATGTLSGYERSFTRDLGPEGLKEGFHLSPEIESIDFELAMTSADFARFTDVAVNVLDRDGASVVKDGFSSRILRFSMRNPAPSKAQSDYTIDIRAGRAVSGSPSGKVTLTLRFRVKDPVRMTGTLSGQQRFQLFPAVPAEVEFQAASTPPMPPAGTRVFGTLEFESEKDGRTWLRLPVRAKGGAE
jgi:subtilisin family serine protease